MCDSFEYSIHYFRLVSVFLCYVFDGIKLIVVIMCVHVYVDESVNHGVESAVFVLYGVILAVVYEACGCDGFLYILNLCFLSILVTVTSKKFGSVLFCFKCEF